MAGVETEPDLAKEIVGREEELERIAAFVDARLGTPAALIIQGHAGIGKTTLWRDAVRRLEAAGARVLRTTPAASEASLSLATLSDLLEPVYHLVRTDLPAPQRRALDVALALEEAGDVEQEGDRLLSAATLGALRALSELTPVALAIDDLQWVDRESAAALTFALRRLRTERVVCVFGLRREADSSFDVAALGEIPVERLNVGPLSLGAIQRLLLSEVGVTLPRPAIGRLVETSGGNPFYALELARGLDRAETVPRDEPPALSRSLDDLIAGRLDVVSDPAHRLLGFLSLLPEASSELLEELGVLEVLDEVVRAGIVSVEDNVARFDHPLLAAGAYARLGPEERRGLHAALVSSLQDPVERARHLARSTISESSEVAADLTAAAMVAASRGLPAVAAELAGSAARFTPGSEASAALERRLLEARSLVHDGTYDDAAALLDEIIPCLPRGDERAEALFLRARVTGGIEPQRRLLHDALGETDDDAIGVAANALLVRNYLYSGEVEDALVAARAADAQAKRTGEPLRIAAATTTRGLMEIWGTGAPDREVYELAQALARSGDELPAETYSNPHTFLGARALYRYEVDEARAYYLVAAHTAEIAGEVDSLETFWWGLAQLEVRAGRYLNAWEYVQRMRESGDEYAWRSLGVRWIEGVLATYEGQIADAREALDDTLERAETGGNWFFVAYTRAALGFLELSVGDPRAAIVALEPVSDVPFVVRGDPGQTGILPLAAEALVLTGDLERAAAVIDHLEARGRELEYPWCLASAARCRGLLLGEHGAFDAALESFDTALEAHEDVPAPFERARTVLALGSVQRRARRRREARETLEVAESTFRELGTPLWAAQARTELDRIGGRAPSRGELTPNELRIATLVSEGKTNKEVATALFVTDRTVESALTQIYRKLDVRSRTELTRKLADRV
jgi:DNA-binding CsgD family transcriptional regulator/tetratricopeptide (TPR) repeat protein